jgi:hypothetical protein
MWAIDQNLGEMYTVDELLDYYPIALQIHRFACPTCGRRVTPVKAILRKKHFKHKDGSPDCPYYYGGDSYGGNTVPKPSFGGVVSRNSREIFEFVGFEPFFLQDTKFSSKEELDEIEVKYHPDKYKGNFFLWVKPIEELRLSNFDLDILISSFITFSKYGRTIVFVINPAIGQDQVGTADLIIKRLVTGSGIAFEIPPLSTLSLDMVKVWILDSEGICMCPGRISLDSLIIRTAFSYNTLKKIMRDLEPFFRREPVKITDPKHTFRSEDLTLFIKCKHCGKEHRIYLVCNMNLDIIVYFRGGSNTFDFIKHLRKFKCHICQNIFLEFKHLEKEWAKEYGEKQLEKKQKELKSVLESSKEDSLVSNTFESIRVKILLGQHIGKNGTVIEQEGENLNIKLDDSNIIIQVSRDIVLYF